MALQPAQLAKCINLVEQLAQRLVLTTVSPLGRLAPPNVFLGASVPLGQWNTMDNALTHCLAH